MDCQLIAIGASTGGTDAIRTILCALPHGCPPIIVTQHISPTVAESYVTELDKKTKIKVQTAEDGGTLEPNHAYFAPGEYHLKIEKKVKRVVLKWDYSAPVQHHRPAVDVMFNSVAQHFAQHTVGIILTGMGSDGALGLKRMHEQGSYTIAQDEDTSIVWGMPFAAISLQAIDDVLPLSDIAPAIIKHIK